jgi:hypothetical protein
MMIDNAQGVVKMKMYYCDDLGGARSFRVL